MKKLILGALVALLPFTSHAATILGFQVGGGNWTHTPGGSIQVDDGNGTATSADLASDLNLGAKSEGYFYFLLEHPVPLVPNIKYVSTNLTSSGSGTANTSFTFNGTTYNTSTNLTTALKMNQTDAILYYEILDNVVSFDLGINAKTIKGNATVNSDSVDFNATIPMLYASAELSLPFDMTVGAEVSTISGGGNQITDTTLKVTYTTSFLLGIEAGLRTQVYNINVDLVKANINFNGIFLGAFYRF